LLMNVNLGFTNGQSSKRLVQDPVGLVA
jgi:hypothetical protein